MTKLAVVPFTENEFAILPYLSKKYDIVSLLTPPGVGVEGEDIGALRNYPKTGYTFCNSITDGILKVDTVIISAIEISRKELWEFAYESLKCAIKNQKKIICFLELDQRKGEFIKEKCIENNVDIVFYNKEDALRCICEKNKFVKTIRPPVIYVAEVYEDCEGYDVLLKMADAMKEAKMNVLVVSADIYNHLLGYSYFKFDDKLSLKIVVSSINKTIGKLIEDSKPDIVLIKLPYPLTRYDENVNFDCGVTAYVISQAIPADSVVICGLLQYSSPLFWKNYLDGIENKFGFSTACVHLCNKVVESNISDENSTVHFPIDSVNKVIDYMNSFSDINFLNLNRSEDMNSLIENIFGDYIDLGFGVIV